MRAAKFESRRANNSNTSMSHGGEAGSQRPVNADQIGLPNGFRLSHGIWASPPLHHPSSPAEPAPWYQPAPGEHQRREPAKHRPTAPVEGRRPETARPPPVPQYRSTAPV